MILILVNILDMNKKELQDKDIKNNNNNNNNNNNHFQLHKKNWIIFENFKSSGSNLPGY